MASYDPFGIRVIPENTVCLIYIQDGQITGHFHQKTVDPFRGDLVAQGQISPVFHLAAGIKDQGPVLSRPVQKKSFRDFLCIHIVQGPHIPFHRRIRVIIITHIKSKAGQKEKDQYDGNPRQQFQFLLHTSSCSFSSFSASA